MVAFEVQESQEGGQAYGKVQEEAEPVGYALPLRLPQDSSSSSSTVDQILQYLSYHRRWLFVKAVELLAAEVAGPVFWNPKSQISPEYQVCTRGLGKLRILILQALMASVPGVVRDYGVHSAWLLHQSRSRPWLSFQRNQSLYQLGLVHRLLLHHHRRYRRSSHRQSLQVGRLSHRMYRRNRD